MRALTPLIVGLGAFAAVALAQTASQTGAAPIEAKSGGNAQAGDEAAPGNVASPANTTVSRDEATPANTTAPVEPKL